LRSGYLKNTAKQTSQILLSKTRLIKKNMCVALSVILLSSCAPQQKNDSVTIVIGSWYGFYPIYYALENRLDHKNGLRLKVIEPTDIGDARRSYMREQVDFVASSMLEFTKAGSFLHQRIEPVLIADYSNGGDVIVANKSINNIEQLKGKRIAVSANGIGQYILSLVFKSKQPSQFFEQIEIRETECEQAFIQNQIDACVTYPPISTYLLNNPNLHTVYDSRAHPRRIFDLVWSKENTSPVVKEKLRNMWFESVELINEDPEKFYRFVARIASVSTDSVRQAMQGIALVNAKQHQQVIQSSLQLSQDLVDICLVGNGKSCEQFASSFDW
jgi:NitT/TauT family transport system substrate-binding protein